jgi:hypothetical protein
VRRLVMLLALAVLAACGDGGADPAAPGPEIRVSRAGPDGDRAWTVSAPAVASAGASDRFLVVWAQGRADATARVWARTVGLRGAVGRARPVSPAGEDARSPAVAWSGANESFLVTWSGSAGDVRRAVHVRRISADGRPLGPAARVSGEDAFTPAVTASDAGWVVAWRGSARAEQQILARRLAGSGRPAGPPVRVSRPSGGATFPAVAAGPGGVLVAWRAAVAGELEVHARVLGRGPRRRVSRQGPDGDSRFAVGPPAVAAAEDGFLVAWAGDTGTAGEDEINVRRLARDGTPTGDPEQVTETGPPGDPEADALGPRLACGVPGCLLAWWGDPELPPLEPDEAEVFVRVLEPGRSRELRLSSAGPDGEYLFAALDPAVAAGRRGWLVTWKADEPGPPLANDEFEVYARAVAR